MKGRTVELRCFVVRTLSIICGMQTDPESETRSGFVYVPRDEAFSEVKSATFSSRTLRSALRAAIPSIQTAVIDAKLGFPHFNAIDSLFGDGLTLPKRQGVGFFQGLLPRLVNAITGGTQELLLFDSPEMIESNLLLSSTAIFRALAFAEGRSVVYPLQGTSSHGLGTKSLLAKRWPE